MALPRFNELKPKYPKDGEGQSRMEDSPGTKCVDEELLRFGQASDIGTAPPVRVYTRDYKKTGREADDQDTVSPFLGNPLGL